MQRQTLIAIVWPIVVGIIVLVAAIFVSGSQTAAKMGAVDTNVPLWAIQPGLGTVMIEYSTRFGNAYWAADAGNFDMLDYQLKEMTEIQEVGETTRPGRADALKKFENDNLQPLIKASAAKDKNAFMAAYDTAITGCNKCHGEQKDAATGKTFKWIRVIKPTSTAPFSNVDWKGSQ
jgi:hypothetical protein